MIFVIVSIWFEKAYYKKASIFHAQEFSSSEYLWSKLVHAAEMKIVPLILKGFLEKSISKLVQDECFLSLFNILIQYSTIHAPTASLCLQI